MIWPIRDELKTLREEGSITPSVYRMYRGWRRLQEPQEPQNAHDQRRILRRRRTDGNRTEIKSRSAEGEKDVLITISAPGPESGEGGRIRRSSKNLTVQFAEFNMGGDKILASATSKKLREMGWEHSCSSIPAAYLTGYMAGKAALKAGIEYAVVDMGPQKPQKGGVLFAAVAGLCDAGMDIPHGDVFPAEDRLLGKHIDEGIEAEIESLKKKMEAE